MPINHVTGTDCEPTRPPAYNAASTGLVGCVGRACFVKVIVVGGGIGGLTTALMLHARGIDCELFEQAETVRELGVGINTLPHAIKELQQLGLMERLDSVAIRTHELIYTKRLRQEILRDTRGLQARYHLA